MGSRRIGRRLYQRTAGRGRRHPAGDGIAVPSPPSLLSVGANPYGQAGADRRDLFASALAVMLPVSAVSALRYRLAGVDPLPRSLLPLLLPAAAGGLLGAFLLERTSPRRLRRLFAAVILVSGIRMLF